MFIKKRISRLVNAKWLIRLVIMAVCKFIVTK